MVDAITERLASVLGRGSVLADRTDSGEFLRLLVSIRQEVVDGHEPPRPVLKRFGYAELYPDGQRLDRTVEAPYLDYDALTHAELDLVRPLLAEVWIADAPKLALAWAAGTDLPGQVAALQRRVSADVVRTRRMVSRRLAQEINYQYLRQAEVISQLRAGKVVRKRPESIERHIAELERRRERRMAELNRDEHLRPLPPAIASLALVIPQGLLERLAGTRDKPTEHYTRDTKRVEMRAVRAVARSRAGTRADSRGPVAQQPRLRHQVLGSGRWPIGVHRGQGTRRRRANTSPSPGPRSCTARTPDNYRLALVQVGVATDEVRYVTEPFDGIDIADDFSLHSVTLRWPDFWRRGVSPS